MTPHGQLQGRAAAAVWLAGTLVGAAAFCVYSQSWQNGRYLMYDIPAALAVYSFPALLLALAVAGRIDTGWFIRLAALAVLTTITLGREFLVWPISGHVTCVVAVAIIQSRDAGLRPALRLAYWLPVPIVVLVRIFGIEGTVDTPLLTGLAAGTVVGAATAWGLYCHGRRGAAPAEPSA